VYGSERSARRSDPPPKLSPSFPQRVLGFLRRHKLGVAGALIGANMIANIGGVAPLQLSTHSDPHAVVLKVQVPGASADLIDFGCRGDAHDTIPTIHAVSAASSPEAHASYRAAIDRYLADEQASFAKEGLTQRANNRSFALLHESAPPKGIAIMLHGFNAGTKQMEALAKQAYDKGYDVLVPSLLGHGLVRADGTEDNRLMPRAGEYLEWRRFLDRLATLGAPADRITLIGHSGGGMLALHLAERHPELIEKVIASSPLLELRGDYGYGLSNQTAANALETAHCLAGEPVANWLADQQVDRQGPGEHPYGSRYVDQGIVLGLIINSKYTLEHAERLRHIRGGAFLILSEADDTIDPKAAQRFASDAGAGTFVFPSAEGVPHTMISEIENHDPRSVAKSQALILERL
jgi:pimeloyl-ACP methyl ester carboxylesterase